MHKLVANITNSRSTQDLLQRHGLNATKVTWEDTGRNKNSCLGPNISDMTLTTKDGALMPVIRNPNYSDVTHDVPMETFQVLVGNEKSGREKKIVSLKDYISNLSEYTDAKRGTSLLLDRDSVVLTNTQCCVLPVGNRGETEFAVQLFNYQSSMSESAVLVIVATKDGTSAQTINGTEKLLSNQNGDAHWLSVERLADARERKGVETKTVDSFKEMTVEEKLNNTIMVIQIPLKVVMQSRKKKSPAYALFANSSSADSSWCMLESCAGSRGMDMGQIGVGSRHSTYPSLASRILVRDDRFPIRCTYQYYRVTDKDDIDEACVKDIAEQLKQVESFAKASGSLVTTAKTDRLTEPMDLSVNSSVWGQASMCKF